jgi:predicted phage terminase large subunit-like protein
MKINGQLTEKQLKAIRKSRNVRRNLAYSSHIFFFSIYLSHYIKYPFADFHYDIFDLTENNSIRYAILTAFRDSGKSTINTLSFPIWAINGCLQKKFVLIASQTQAQAKYHLSNIRKELEGNELLKNDIGPFHEEDDEWGASSLVLSNHDARITIASTEQSIRGIRHGAHRPDLVICDDVEDLNSVKTREGRKKTWDWLTGEVLPIGSKNTKFVIVGNLLHEDSLIMKLEKRIEEGRFKASYFKVPIYDENNVIAWPGKYPTWQDIENLKLTVASEVAWYREYLLKIISDEDRVVHPEWIHYYDELPPDKDLRFVASGVDLAISKKETADYTAIVSASVYGYSKDRKIYILPNPINKRMTFPETFETIKTLSKSLGGGHSTKIFIEDVGYQAALIQQLNNAGCHAEGVKIKGQDKKARLSLTTAQIQSGQILFPRHGCERLIEQLTGFGIEKHDDLADAFSLLILRLSEDKEVEPQLYILDIPTPPRTFLSELSDNIYY